MANIRTARRSGLVLRGGRQRRESLWLAIGETSTALAAANTAALVATLNAAALALVPFTVVRTRLAWSMRSDQSAATEVQEVGIGMSVVSTQATAVGVTAVPTPFTDLDSDLFYLHEIWLSTFLVVTGAGFFDYGSRNIDSKAMRKVEDGQDIILTLENGGASSGSTSLTAGRFLIKLH